MRTLALCSVLFLFAGGLVLTTGACGGGTTAAPATSTNLLFGPYCYGSWLGDVSGPNVIAQWGTLDADGMSTMSFTSVTANVDGLVSSPPTATGSLTYAILAGNALSIQSGPVTLLGGVASDGSVAVNANVTPSIPPAIVTFGRKGSGFGLASLSGDYHMCAYVWNGLTDVAFCFWGGTATFNGAGACTAFAAGVNDGTVSAPPGAPAPNGTYTVAPDGTLGWTPLLAGPLQGGLLAGGEIAILTGSTMNGTNVQSVTVLIKKGAGLGNATFSGTYHGVALFDPPPPATVFGSAALTITADAAGVWSVGQQTINQDGIVTTIPPGGGSSSYTVAGDGRLDLGAGGSLRGGVSASGRYAIFAGPTVAGSNPQFWLLVR